ncbi:MAG: HEAT repeat domain-containing protein [bacterium]
MKWIIAIVILIAGVYYHKSQRKAEELKKQKYEESINRDMPDDRLPDKLNKKSTVRLSVETRRILRNMARDSDEKVRWASLELLYQLDDEQAAAIIRESLVSEPDLWIKQNTISMLGQHKDRQSLALLQVALDGYDKEIRLSAVQAIGNFDNADALPILNKAMEDYDPDVKLKAIEALNKIQKTASARKGSQLRNKPFSLFSGKEPAVEQ